MKKLIGIMVIIVIACLPLTMYGCHKVESYEVMKSTFAFGADGFHYAPTIELSVGETVYMALEVKVNAYNKNGKQEGHEEVQCTLTIPKITAIDAYYYSGQPITGKPDPLTGNVTYTFTIGTNTTKTDGEKFIFKFVPAEAGSVRMDLTFADPIPQRYNTFKIIDFVNEE